ncbi:hypothetical protein DPMN_058267 [Dreissena polymorpha]|uniref:Uncharacterized protein n=1 Tax=Dreissena polymorpha TaxID=45954 RepID=A0A9D4C1F4_DREPO|nr:hypothetical protein DPMN_058267 [Dreissena polymorpha]
MCVDIEAQKTPDICGDMLASKTQPMDQGGIKTQKISAANNDPSMWTFYKHC